MARRHFRLAPVCLLMAHTVSAFQGGASGAASLARSSFAPSACSAPKMRAVTAQSNNIGGGGVLGLRAVGSGDIERLFSPFGEWGKSVGRSVDWFFDTSDVAGAKAWRLQMPPGEGDAAKWRSGDMLEEMAQDQIASRREKAMAGAMSGQALEFGEDDDLFGSGLEYSMTDEDLGDALRARFESISQGIREPSGEEENLTGLELAEMCVRKYGVAHDMAIKVDNLALVSDKKLVSLNLYYSYYGQLNPEFPYTDTEYITRLNALASLVNQWNQQDYVREFFAEKPTPYRGLPSRPRWDTAVSIRLYKSPTWNPALADDFFHA